MSKSKRAKWRGNVGSMDGNGASEGVLSQRTSTAQGDGFSSIESAPAAPSDSSYVNLVKKPVRIETTEIELALHKCYDDGDARILAAGIFFLVDVWIDHTHNDNAFVCWIFVSHG